MKEKFKDISINITAIIIVCSTICTSTYACIKGYSCNELSDKIIISVK